MRKLYHCDGARSMRSLWLLHELGLEFELVTLPFSMAGLRTPDYLAVSPLGRVPCLVDGDLTLFESGAIAQYLCETYDDGRLHRAPGHPERPAWLQWLHYAETVAAHGASLVQQQVFVPPEQRSPVVSSSRHGVCTRRWKSWTACSRDTTTSCPRASARWTSRSATARISRVSWSGRRACRRWMPGTRGSPRGRPFSARRPTRR